MSVAAVTSSYPATRMGRVLLTIAVFLVAFAGTIAVALLNTLWFDVVNGFVGATDTVARGLLFSSWLVLVGGIVVVRHPAMFGFRVGDIRGHLVLVVGTVVATTAATVALLRVIGSTPYSDASLFIEAVDVPVTEELVFRAVLLTGLIFVLTRLWPAGVALPLAIVFDAVAFGAAHLANLMAIVSAFVIGQAVFAAVLGGLCGVLMVRTRSIYPAMVLHAAVNTAVVLCS